MHSVFQKSESTKLVSPRLPTACGFVREVHGFVHVHSPVCSATLDYNCGLHSSGKEVVVEECNWGHHCGAILCPQAQEEDDAEDVNDGGRGVCCLLVSPELLRGACLQQGHQHQQCPVLHLPLVCYEQYVLQPLHLLLA